MPVASGWAVARGLCHRGLAAPRCARAYSRIHIALAFGLLGLCFASARAYEPLLGGAGPLTEISAGMVLDGSIVHNVGELQVNVTNFGVFGSFPGSALPMSESPSAQWPAGSGIEYLYCAGLWIGARSAGIPRVTTALYDYELAPAADQSGQVLRSFEGNDGGNRQPSPYADDDRDGRLNEDPFNGLDDDGDGYVDEDYEAISNQMFSCSYWDNRPEILRTWPDHQPLNVRVVQESYQWENTSMRHCVGIRFTVHNEGYADLGDVLLGFYVDPDIGARSRSRRHEDDLVTHFDSLFCVRQGPSFTPYRLRMAMAFDDDGDWESASPAPGWLGVVLLGHSTDPAGAWAPLYEGISGWQTFRARIPYGTGGEALSDLERYEALTERRYDLVPSRPDDYRFLVSFGPFQLEPADSVELDLALVLGEGRAGLLSNAMEAVVAYGGGWFDLDDNDYTGSRCQETLLYDPKDPIIWTDPCGLIPEPITIPRGNKVWVNQDCIFEAVGNILCDNFNRWCTGTHGLESQIHWLMNSAPPPPNLRVWCPSGSNVLFWDDFSENVLDTRKQIIDFEGYHIWRADNWQRPDGSSQITGPPTNLWMLIGDFDRVNDLGRDTGLESLRYQPNVDANLVAYYISELLSNPYIQSPLDRLPPPGYSLADADTALALAKYDLGKPGGKRYYRYADEGMTNGMHYFYSVTATDHDIVTDPRGLPIGIKTGLVGSPSGNFVYAIPQSASQSPWDYQAEHVYVVPNPATSETMRPWTLQPNNSDPTGLKVEFRNLPAAQCTIRIYTIAGDLVQTLTHDGLGSGHYGEQAALGTKSWNLISRNGQQIASGIYLFTIDAEGFPRNVGKFVVIR